MTGEIGKATTRPTTKDKVLLDSVNFKGEVIRVGGFYISLHRGYLIKLIQYSPRRRLGISEQLSEPSKTHYRASLANL